MRDKGGFLESLDEIPEPHAFTATMRIGEQNYPVVFEEHEHAHGSAARDNNMRAAVVHVIADAAVSVLVIVGLLLARAFGWLWMDPLAGIIGACVIASWSYGLIRDTGAILLDMNPDRGMANKLREEVEAEGDTLADLHLWRLGPGHLGAIISVVTSKGRDADYYRNRLARFKSLSHHTDLESFASDLNHLVWSRASAGLCRHGLAISAFCRSQCRGAVSRRFFACRVECAHRGIGCAAAIGDDSCARHRGQPLFPGDPDV
jgi:hypothetical protein